jgi:hypothetical protein
MNLRDHPLMSFRGLGNWPPVWTWIGGEVNTHPTGEIGVLKEVKTHLPPLDPKLGKPVNRIFLFIEYRQSLYVGSLLFSDFAFCQSLGTVLQSYCGYGLKEIGDVDVNHLL